jgi:Leucine-rich repeat (LRR) protein
MNKLGDKGTFVMAKALVEREAQIEYLDLTNCLITEVGGGFLMRSIKKNHQLLSLTLDHNNLGSQYVTYVV